MAVSFFNRKASSSTNEPAPEDRVLLRDAVVALLQPHKRNAGAGQHVRIRRLEERLRRFPAPTGIVREVEKIADSASRGAPGDGAAPAPEKAQVDLMPLVEELVKALQAVALVDQRLEVGIERFSKGMPKNPVAADIRRLQNQVGDIARLGHKVRKQTIQERAEMSHMLSDMGEALAAAGTQSDSVVGSIDKIARTFVAMPMPQELAAARRQVLGELKGMHQKTRQLRTGLEAAEKRSKELEDIVTKTTKALHDARQQAATDPLTGLANRGAFDRALTEGMQSARRMRRPFTLVVIDIDHFKSVNDTYGHPVGDVVIKAVADRMRQELRDQDTVARYGGEEFALLLEGAPEGIAFSVADRIRERVASNPVPIPPEESATGEAFEVQITLSAGLSVFKETDSPEAFLKRADQALYKAKRGGRNQVQVLGGEDK
jgi:diguanylate cyclase